MNRNDKSFLAEKIRTQYVKHEETDLDALRKLDRKVKRPANIFAYIFGSISALIMGIGMSLVMTDIGAVLGIAEYSLPAGIAIGIVGIILAAVNYPIFKSILNSRKKKYADKIISLSEKIVEDK